MTDYFTTEHFDLLKEWQGQKRDKSIDEQNKAYEELSEAYKVTEAWATALKDKLFPMGRVKVLKRPTSQWNIFFEYNWARIYPTKDSPTELAYTVGIGADLGFVVNIDTVGLNAKDSARRDYEALRGDYDSSSPIIATLSVSEGLQKSLEELVEWSADSISKFGFSYTDILTKLSMGTKQSDEELLQRFDGKPAFKTYRTSWSPQDKATFCSLARAVHAVDLDWWHMGSSMGNEVRFGRKNPGSERATAVLGVIRGTSTRKISWRRDVGDLAKFNRQSLTDELVATIDSVLSAEQEMLDELLAVDDERSGLWPDQLQHDPSESDDELDDDGLPIQTSAKQAMNRIYYGPPGTGKTYQVTKLLEKEYEQKMTQVTPEEWQSQFIAENIESLTWWESAAVALHDLGGKAKVDELLDHPFVKAVIAVKSTNNNVRNTIWGALQYHTVETSETVKMSKRMAPAVFDKSTESEWRFAGDWADTCADLIGMVKAYHAGPPVTGSVSRYSFVTFHQSYGYEEFVEGLRPVLDEEAESGSIRYEIRSGAFKELCRKARLAPAQRFAMVIDEINRGNISKIFGELITLIEADKREGSTNAISVTLPYSGKPFSVPPNVDIIGTMNTADRSLALLDTALRRRFDFIAVLPDSRDESDAPLHGLRVTVGDQAIDIPQMLTAINQRIEALYDRDHCIGHAYFTPLRGLQDGRERFSALSAIFTNRIVPLLKEYFFEDWQKIQLVLADNQKLEASRFVVEHQEHENDLDRLFGGDHGLDAYTTKRRYVIQESAFENPDAYIGIYKTLHGR